jgi:hypothetical protein
MVRQFRDAAGVEWRVFEAEPHGSGTSGRRRLPPEFQGGWLVFESSTEKRRLAPRPPEWAAFTVRELEQACKQAVLVASRSASTTSRSTTRPVEASTLQPKLREVVGELERQLDEVCQVPAAERLDTGELIRVEETLAMAADKAKQAVSLRRKLREHQSAQSAARVEPNADRPQE